MKIEITDEMVWCAVLAYDTARCACHGPSEKPMSKRNRETIAPMIRAALEAVAPLIADMALERVAREIETQRDDVPAHGWEFAAAIRALKEPT